MKNKYHDFLMVSGRSHNQTIVEGEFAGWNQLILAKLSAATNIPVLANRYSRVVTGNNINAARDVSPDPHLPGLLTKICADSCRLAPRKGMLIGSLEPTIVRCFRQ